MWSGVTCSRRHPQRVIALKLRSQNLAGYLSPHIGNLSFLRIIELANNSFQGQIPPEIGRLRRLSFLHLANNSFNGEVPARYWLKTSSKKSPIISSTREHFSGLTYAELLKATDGFSSANLIGVGSFGFVYKGFLDQLGLVAAIKVLKLQQHRASKSFIAECKVLRSIRHRNIVKILSVCSSIDFTGNDFKALIFEYMPNGSLDTWLHPNEEQHNSTHLNFMQRLNVAIDVASALDYLHHHCEAPVVHCDLKPSNILLDEDMVAHVGDFGLARIFSKDVSNCSQAQSSSIGIKGSIGYVAPEYGMGGDVSTYGDVYSYGILLLEMFTGKRPTDDIFKDNLNLHQLATMAFPERVIEIIDHRLLLEGNEKISSNEDYNEMRSRIHECLLSLVRIAGGILDETGQHLGGRFSLSQQVMNFESNMNDLRNEMGPNNLTQNLAKSIALMVSGSNDYLINYLLPYLYNSSLNYTPQGYADLLLNHYTRQILALHSVGKRKFFLAGLGPLGYVPNQLALNQTPPGQCISSVNEIVGLFNVGLKSLVDQLNGNHTGAIFLYGNANGAIIDMLNNPSTYGFQVTNEGYCGIGRNKGQAKCSIDVASALDYLHHHCEAPVVHCDLKPSNVLLEEDMVAYVGNFGLARIFSKDVGNCSQTQSSSIGIKGSIGYVAPEYGMGGEVSTYGNMYSHGILLLEMFTGKRPTDDIFKDNLNLHQLAKMAFPKRVIEIIDHLLLLQGNENISSNEDYSEMRSRMHECLLSLVRIDDISLVVKFPFLPFPQNKKVASLWNQNGWTLPVNLPQNVTDFLHQSLHILALNLLQDDKIFWKGNSSQSLSFKEAWQIIRSCSQRMDWAPLV
ncbi:hypothetical protein AAC387_Pa04g0989 [Persea americana]